VRQLALAPLFLVACFVAGEPPTRCSAEQPGCPDGLMCVGEICLPPGTGELGQPVDLSVSDLSQSSLCADGKGFAIGNQGVWACPGVFTAGQASTLCANGKICLDSNLIPSNECLSVSGFFVSQVWGTTDRQYSTPSISECKSANNSFPNAVGFYGCGKGGGVVDKPCDGFRGILICTASTKLSCAFSIDTVANANPTNGVLCCPK
jgi:hypothetical protein